MRTCLCSSGLLLVAASRDIDETGDPAVRIADHLLIFMSTALSVLPALGVNSCCAAGYRLEPMRTTGRVGAAFFEIRDIGCDVGDDSCGLGIEPCDRNGVGHGAMVAPDAGIAFHGACWVMCEALIADEGIDSPGMRDEDPYELTRAGSANHSHAA